MSDRPFKTSFFRSGTASIVAAVSILLGTLTMHTVAARVYYNIELEKPPVGCLDRGQSRNPISPCRSPGCDPHRPSSRSGLRCDVRRDHFD